MTGSGGVRAAVAERLLRVRRRWRLVLRLGVATSGAYAISTHVLGHDQAFFAPIAAAIVIVAGAGLRVRTLTELVVGVVVGVGVGELLILAIGRGAWQIALVVALTVVVGTLLGIRGLALTQAVNSSILLAAVLPAPGAADPALTRFLDAAVGGLCGLAMVLLLPRTVVRDIDAGVQQVLARLAAVLRRTAQALRTRDAALAAVVLAEARSTQGLVDEVGATARNVTEIARIAPLRWRQRAEVERYAGSVTDLDNALRDARVLARRVAAMLRHREAPPAGLDAAVESLASAVDTFAAGLADPARLQRARGELADAAHLAITALTGVMTINSAAVAAQVRSLAADLLYASGASRDDIDVLLDARDD